MFFKQTVWAAIIGMAALGACSPSVGLPDESEARITGIPVDTLLAGRKLYLERCSGCHNLYLPGAYTTGDWELWVKRMEKPAKLSKSEGDLVLKYLQVKSLKR